MALINNIIGLSRISKQLILMLVDSVLAVFALLSSFALRLEDWIWPQDELFWLVFGSPILIIAIFYSFALYQSVTRFSGLKSLFSISLAVTLYSTLWGLIGYMVGFEGTPRSVIIINWLVILILILGSRIFARWVLGTDEINNKSKINVIIYGTGPSARQLSTSLHMSSEYKHVAYLDDNIKQIGSYLNNIKVYSPEKISLLIEKYNVKEVFLTLPLISRKQKNKIIEELSQLSVLVRSLPSLAQLTEGKIKIDDLLEIDVTDLLGRNTSSPNQDLLKGNITNKVVMITGAGGSIGSELSRQVLLLKPKKIILFDISEHALYLIEQILLKMNNSGIEIYSVLGSVASKKRLCEIFDHFKVQTLYHAAAYKHVPLVEYNQAEGVLNNSLGTLSIAEAAITSKVETFVLISTDKAVRPTNTMGATKRVAELILQALAKESHSTCFTMVRFGNVLDSSGSVIPLFKKQIRNGGPVTVTDKNIVRFFMTIPEAVQLVIQAGAMSSGGDVFVLDMGSPIRIYDLAVKMIQLSGLKVLGDNNFEGDIEIKFTGLRPGEKLYEELLVGDNVTNTDNKLIMRAEEEMIEWAILKPLLIKLNEAAQNSEIDKIRTLLIKLVPEFKPQSPIVDLTFKNKH